MELNYRKDQNTVIVYLKGRIDIHLAEAIEHEINKLLKVETSCHFIFNIRDVEYISSSGVRLFVTVMTTLKQKRKKFAICNPGNPVRKLLEVVRLTELFNIFRTEKEALDFLIKQE